MLLAARKPSGWPSSCCDGAAEHWGSFPQLPPEILPNPCLSHTQCQQRQTGLVCRKECDNQNMVPADPKDMGERTAQGNTEVSDYKVLPLINPTRRTWCERCCFTVEILESDYRVLPRPAYYSRILF